MALQAFTGVMTAQQIVKRADRLAGNPNLYLNDAGTEDLTAFGYQALQEILDHLALTKDWGWNTEVLNFQISSRITVLPTNFWRVQFGDALYVISSDGNRHKFILADAESFYDRVVPTVAGKNVPNMGYIDHASGLLTVNVTPDVSYLAEFHHQPWEPALAAISAKPWFPYSRHLVYELASDLCAEEDDDRAGGYQQLAAKLFSDIRQGDPTKTPAQVAKMNPRYYRPPVRFN